ncbi:putative exodeoxyribonuclease [Pseudoalteromonas phage J2-1_QLiu-2017]|nr:putative exodeoxyribonuclease [Pseudoalteromonas phage J2-1_QLiu-2017]
MSRFKNRTFTSEKPQEEVFVRDETPNSLLPSLQVDNLADFITEDTTLVIDGDGIVWKACAAMEELYIEVLNKKENQVFELENVTALKGRVRSGFSENSWIGIENVKREAEGKEPYVLEDFEVTPKQRLGRDHKEALEEAKMIIFTKLKKLRQQFGINKTLFVIGEGDCFRHDLILPAPYKGNRSEQLRPIILKEIRQWILSEDFKKDARKSEKARKGFETDDVVEWYGAAGYANYLKTGKFSYVVCAEDKDSWSNPKALTNFATVDGKFKYAQPWIIENSAKSVGIVDLVSKGSTKDLKGSGLKWLVAQAFCIGDAADNYHPYKFLDDKFKKNVNYGVTAAYKQLMPLSTPQSILQMAVDNFAEWFPHGLVYESQGKEYDVDTFFYMDQLFRAAYMTRSPEDRTTFELLCNHYKVDLSKVKDNNRYTAPVKTINKDKAVELLLENVQAIEGLVDSEFKGLASMKKGDLVEKLKDIKELLEQLTDIEDAYEMVSVLKPQFAQEQEND